MSSNVVMVNVWILFGFVTSMMTVETTRTRKTVVSYREIKARIFVLDGTGLLAYNMYCQCSLCCVFYLLYDSQVSLESC